MQDVAEVVELEALVLGGLADADPDEVALAHVQHALGEVHEVVELPLDDRLEVGLHLAAGDVDDDRERDARALFELVELGADDLDLAVRRPRRRRSVRTNSKAVVRWPPASTYVSSLRTRSPSNAGP